MNAGGHIVAPAARSRCSRPTQFASNSVRNQAAPIPNVTLAGKIQWILYWFVQGEAVTSGGIGAANPPRADSANTFMLAFCANPTCYAPLHSFAEGRLFQFEVTSISVAASDDTTEPFDEKPERQTAQFWLCGQCASSMTLTLEPLRGLKLVPIGESRHSDGGDLAGNEDEIRPMNSC